SGLWLGWVHERDHQHNLTCKTTTILGISSPTNSTVYAIHKFLSNLTPLEEKDN
ncbi:unnamed protein product, partial [Dovyalis caffra]